MTVKKAIKEYFTNINILILNSFGLLGIIAICTECYNVLGIYGTVFLCTEAILMMLLGFLLAIRELIKPY